MFAWLVLLLIPGQQPAEPFAADFLGSHSSFDAEWRVNGTWLQGGRTPAGTRNFESSVTLGRDGDNWTKEELTKRTRFHRGALQVRSTGIRRIVFDKTSFELDLNYSSRKHDGSDVLLVRNYEKKFNPGLEGELFSYVLGRSALQFITYPEALKRSDRVTSTRNGSVVTISAEGKHGSISVAFDTARNGCLVSITERQGGEHVGADGVALKDIPDEKGGAILSNEVSMTTLSTTVVAGRHVPSTWKYTHRVENALQGIAAYERTVDTRRFNVPSTLDRSAYLLSTYIADGTRVQDSSDEAIAYEWRNGAVVKSFNKGVADSEYAHARPGGRRVLPIATGAVAAVVIAWMLAKRRRTPS